MRDLYYGEHPVDMTPAEARVALAELHSATPYVPNPIAADTTVLWVQFSDDGQHMRKWSLEPFPRAFEFKHARLYENEKCRSALHKQDAEKAERTVSYMVAHWLRRQCADPMLPEFAEFLTAYADAIEHEEWRISPTATPLEPHLPAKVEPDPLVDQLRVVMGKFGHDLTDEQLLAMKEVAIAARGGTISFEGV